MGADERGVTRRYGRRLQQVGAGLFLLGLLVGLAVPRFALPRLALSTHLLGLMQGLFLLVAGGLWPRLRLSAALSRVGHVAAVVGCVARVGRQPGWCFVGRGEHDGAAGCGRGSRHRAAGGRHQAPPLVGCAVSHRDRGAPPLGPAWVPRVGVGDAVETRGGRPWAEAARAACSIAASQSSPVPKRVNARPAGRAGTRKAPAPGALPSAVPALALGPSVARARA
jgi:hypothetical protein